VAFFFVAFFFVAFFLPAFFFVAFFLPAFLRAFFLAAFFLVAFFLVAFFLVAFFFAAFFLVAFFRAAISGFPPLSIACFIPVCGSDRDLNSFPANGFGFEIPGVHRPNCEYLSASKCHNLKAQTVLHVSNRNDRAFVATEVTTRFIWRQGNSSKKTWGCALNLRLMSTLFDERTIQNSTEVAIMHGNMSPRLTHRRAWRAQSGLLRTTKRCEAKSSQKLLDWIESSQIGGVPPTGTIPDKGRAYFLWRCRLNSLRCLCLRIFLRRFLITLPNGFLPAPWSAARFASKPWFRDCAEACQGEAAIDPAI
jgi:hypothetical protein